MGLPHLSVTNAIANLKVRNAIAKMEVKLPDVAAFVGGGGSMGQPIGLLLVLTYSRGQIASSVVGKGPNMSVKNT